MLPSDRRFAGFPGEKFHPERPGEVTAVGDRDVGQVEPSGQPPQLFRRALYVEHDLDIDLPPAAGELANYRGDNRRPAAIRSHFQQPLVGRQAELLDLRNATQLLDTPETAANE